MQIFEQKIVEGVVCKWVIVLFFFTRIYNSITWIYSIIYFKVVWSMTKRDFSFGTPKELTVGTILKVEKFRETFFFTFSVWKFDQNRLRKADFRWNEKYKLVTFLGDKNRVKTSKISAIINLSEYLSKIKTFHSVSLKFQFLWFYSLKFLIFFAKMLRFSQLICFTDFFH